MQQILKARITENRDESEFVAAAPVFTISEVARALRCSKAHISNVIRGKFRNLPPLPVVRIGRRALIRNDALQAWIIQVEGLTPQIRSNRLMHGSADPML